MFRIDYRDYQGKRKTHRVVVIISMVAIIFFAVMLFYNYQHTFSSEKWKSEPEKREFIVQDLLKKYELIGMSENEVIELLGDEDEKGSQQSSFKGDNTYYPPDSTLVYYIGKDFVDGRWLVLSLSRGIVNRISFGVT